MRVRDKLQELALALGQAGETKFADAVGKAAVSTDEELRSFLTSNELWGGAGSIADQAGVQGERSGHRRRIEAALVSLGREQAEAGCVNARTSMWVEAFEQWAGDSV